ncbi:MAG: hypothetical protein ACI4S3_05610 [Candidatus Gastranaerophilaceae bacterium]
MLENILAQQNSKCFPMAALTILKLLLFGNDNYILRTADNFAISYLAYCGMP